MAEFLFCAGYGDITSVKEKEGSTLKLLLSVFYFIEIQ